MQIEEYKPEVLNLTEFIEAYHIDMILNNDLINKSYFELYNNDEIYNNFLEDVTANPEDYININNLTPEEVQEEINNYVLENYNYLEVYQYFIVDESDVTRYINKYLNYPIFYSSELDIYLLGITHYGMSWSFFFTEAPRPQHMRIKKYDEILKAAEGSAA